MFKTEILFVAINTSFSHMSLAPYRLAACVKREVTIREYTINDNVRYILNDIYSLCPEIICFSTYIWNVSLTEILIHEIHKLIPNITIIVGGPEVSFGTEKFLRLNPCVSYVVRGEGEYALAKLLDGDTGLSSYIKADKYIDGGYNICENPDFLPSPYDERMRSAASNKIIYVESSRGCPYACSYCLSASAGKLRFLSETKLFEQLLFIETFNVKTVKFVDRTFNADGKRAERILKFIISMNSTKTFHFELNAALITPSFLEIIKSAPNGLFQFEAGIQTTSKNTLSAINRKINTEKLYSNIREMSLMNNIHIHTDLIAGLPLETPDSFIRSFNDAYSLGAHMLQLGFLKILKGSPLEQSVSTYGLKYMDIPPYTVLETDTMPYSYICELEYIENVLELYHNSGRFIRSLDFIISKIYNGSAYSFYRRMSDYAELRKSNVSPVTCIKFLYSTVKKDAPQYLNTVSDLIRFDRMSRDEYDECLPTTVIHTTKEIRSLAIKHITQNSRLSLSDYRFAPFAINPDDIDKCGTYLIIFNIKDTNGPFGLRNYEILSLDL